MSKTLKNKIFDNWIAAIIILPINILIIIPSILLYLTNFTFTHANIFQIIFALVTGIIGLFFAGWRKSCDLIFILTKQQHGKVYIEK